MKRSIVRFFHSVVAVLVMTISATSAHADLNEGCELQSDYGAVLDGVAGLTKLTEKLGCEEAKAVATDEKEKLAQDANKVFGACVDEKVEQSFRTGEPIKMAETACLKAEDAFIARLRESKDKSTNKYCYPASLAGDFEKVINQARAMRTISYGHGIERK